MELKAGYLFLDWNENLIELKHRCSDDTDNWYVYEMTLSGWVFDNRVVTPDDLKVRVFTVDEVLFDEP